MRPWSMSSRWMHLVVVSDVVCLAQDDEARQPLRAKEEQFASRHFNHAFVEQIDTTPFVRHNSRRGLIPTEKATIFRRLVP
jgi:hypothetical protein